MNVLSLFTGIGGLDLGLQRAGMTIAGQVEIDPWCRRVLAKHWPEVPRHDDVRTCAEWWFELPWPVGHGRPRIDLVAGGFPCQPVSIAGKRLAQADERWLWPAMAAAIRGLRPQLALMENPTGLLSAGMGDVLGDLAALGYDAEWDCVPASAVGAPHQRDRVWIVAYPRREGLAQREGQRADDGAQLPSAERGCDGTADMADAAGIGRGNRPWQLRWVGPERCGWWTTEPGMGRVAHGIPRRVDRLRGLGNAVVPQVAEHIGRMILDAAS